jgi:Cytochrome C biogenesis protein transmembrane region
MWIIFPGFLAGFLHVLLGPDHLAAVSPIAFENKKNSWKVGFKWGLGHTSGVIIIGILVLLFREFILIDMVSAFSERIVGIVLIGIGVWGLQTIFRRKIHAHQQVEINYSPVQTEIKKGTKHFHTHTAMYVGIIHGLAGSSHLLGVLPALALPTQTQAVVYLISFGIGTILAMVLFSQVLGILALNFAGRSLKLYRSLSIGFSSMAIAVGVFWLLF